MKEVSYIKNTTPHTILSVFSSRKPSFLNVSISEKLGFGNLRIVGKLWKKSGKNFIWFGLRMAGIAEYLLTKNKHDLWKHFIIHEYLQICRVVNSSVTDLCLPWCYLGKKDSAPACTSLLPVRTINQMFASMWAQVQEVAEFILFISTARYQNVEMQIGLRLLLSRTQSTKYFWKMLHMVSFSY